MQPTQHFFGASRPISYTNSEIGLKISIGGGTERADETAVSIFWDIVTQRHSMQNALN